MQSFGILRFTKIGIFVTIFEKTQILVHKIGHRFLETTNLFTRQKAPIMSMVPHSKALVMKFQTEPTSATSI